MHPTPPGTAALARRSILATNLVRFARRIVAPAVVALCALATSPVPGGAIVIDSFTDALPPNPLLVASSRPILFLGQTCDGDACPPGTVVTGPEFSDRVEQAGLPGIVGPVRSVVFATYFEPNPGASGDLVVDPAGGGSLVMRGTTNPSLAAALTYGNETQFMNFDLRADGSDRFEIDILAASSSPWGVGQVIVQLQPENCCRIGSPSAGQAAVIYGPGLLVIPFADLGDRLDEFEHDVAFMSFQFVGGGGELVVGEIRTASTPTPARASSWGRIKGTYRR
jgi:hypothetical protein